MRVRRWVACGIAAFVAVAGCSPEKSPPQATATTAQPTSASPSATPSVSPSPSPSPSARPTVSPTPRPSPTPTRPSPTPPRPTPPPGTVLTTRNAYLQPSEDENLTAPDPENGCAVHDPDLDDVACGVVAMPGGVATWITGREQHTLPGADEPRIVVRVYQRLRNGTDSLTYVGIGEPGQWAGVDVRTGSLTGQTRDTLVVVVTFRGSGTYAGYDLVTWRRASPMRLAGHHPEGSHAQIYVRSRGYVSTYVADYSNGAPNCCPTSWQHDNVRWYAPNFRLVRLSNVSQPPPS
ncbi:MAG TPA: hypothetical protein VF519_17510 [Mycobacteriales bacterium]|jgi:hypothetical protein